MMLFSSEAGFFGFSRRTRFLVCTEGALEEATNPDDCEAKVAARERVIIPVESPTLAAMELCFFIFTNLREEQHKALN